MATPTTLNIGEPADERSVDGDSKPRGGESEAGDNEADKTKKSENKLGLIAPLPTYPDYNGAEEVTPGFSTYQDQESYDADDDQELEIDPSFENTDESKFRTLHITLGDVFFRIIPSIGAASYEYFSLKITSPAWFLRAFSGVDQTISNVLWVQAHAGVGLYVFSRRHFRTMPLSKRMLYSTFGSFLFNYGSCLLWALGRNYLPRLPAVHAAFGLLSGGILLYVGQDYLHYIDKTCTEID